jgi:hypothetical protein
LSQADRRINFLLNRHFKNDPAIRPLIAELANHDPTPKKKYLAWLVKHWIEGHRFPKKSRIRENLKLHALACERKWTFELGDKFHSDIFCYTPQTFQSMMAKHRKAVRYLIKLDAIEKGLPVTCPGAEIVHQDELYTVIRIRTRPALGLLSHYGSWCTRSYRYSQTEVQDEYGDTYCFPFDVILAIDGNRYLRNFSELRDHWNKEPPAREQDQILELCSGVQDTLERLEEQVGKCVRDGVRMPPEMETALIKYPNLAAEYAVQVLRERWPEFEQKASLEKIHAGTIYQYCRSNRFRWERVERKILRARYWAEHYAAFFDLPWSWPEKKRKSRPKLVRSEEPVEIRNANMSATRCRDEEQKIAARPRYLDYHLSEFVRAFESEHQERLLERAKSYFRLDGKSEEWEFRLAQGLVKKLSRRVRAIENEIAKVPESAFLYTIRLIGRRFRLFEPGILTDPKLAKRYADEVIKDRWFEAEPIIRRDVLEWSRYSRQHNLRY